MKKLSKLALSIVEYQISKQYMDKMDKYYYINKIVNEFSREFDYDATAYVEKEIETLFNELGILAERELKVSKEVFINKISDIVAPSPKEVRETFKNISKFDPRKAFTFFNNLSKDIYYIKKDRINKNIAWEISTKYGEIKLSINKSKPEKSIYDIVKASNSGNKYPKCVLCRENMGYWFSDNSIPKQNLRYANTRLDGKLFYMHYSPYGYYNEHLIINDWNHVPMEISATTYNSIIDFVEKYKFYFIGSNADLPIVGGSILNHSHYQGGAKELPIFEAKPKYNFTYKKCDIEILNWPLSVLKIKANSKSKILELANVIHKKWINYNKVTSNIINSKANRHNTITPLAEFSQGKYVVYMFLRNNATDFDHPLGIYHVNKKRWNIKKENIGIIEVAGKAILPSRLESEIGIMCKSYSNGEKVLPEKLKHHQEWYEDVYKKILPNSDIKRQFFDFVAKTFVSALEDTAVFRNKDDFLAFVESINGVK